MAFITPVRVDNPGKTNEAIFQLLSPEKVEENIRSIDATQIEIIGHKMIETVLHRLGPVGKYEAEKLVVEHNEKENQVDPSARAALGHYKILADQAKGKPFLSAEQTAILAEASLQPVRTKIEQSFSTPSEFIKTGLGFCLSKYNPEGFIANAAIKNGLQMNMTHIPLQYRVRLELDQSLTQKHQDLVFVIKELSDLVPFNKITFTIKSSELALI